MALTIHDLDAQFKKIHVAFPGVFSGLVVACCARVILREQISRLPVQARWSGARSPHCGADSKICVKRLSTIFFEILTITPFSKLRF